MSETEIKKGIDPDCVCPVCFKPTWPAVMEPEAVAEGVRRRAYSCWCEQCDIGGGAGFIVVQFYDGGRWRIEKYISIKPLYQFDGPWQIIQEAIPNDETEPLIQTGPGGDYQKTFTAEQITAVFEQYGKIQKVLSAAGGQIVEMLRRAVRSK